MDCQVSVPMLYTCDLYYAYFSMLPAASPGTSSAVVHALEYLLHWHQAYRFPDVVMLLLWHVPPG